MSEPPSHHQPSNVPTAGIEASSLGDGWAIIHHAGPVRNGGYHVFEFLVLGHAGFLTMFSFTVLRAVVMK